MEHLQEQQTSASAEIENRKYNLQAILVRTNIT